MTETIRLGEITIAVTRKNIKHVHLSVHPPGGRVTLVAPMATRPEVASATYGVPSGNDNRYAKGFWNFASLRDELQDVHKLNLRARLFHVPRLFHLFRFDP